MRARGRLSVEETEDYAAALRIAKEQGFSSVREAYLAAAGAARDHFADVSKMVDGKPASVLEAARAYYEEKERAGRSVHTLHDIRVRVFRRPCSRGSPLSRKREARSPSQPSASDKP